MHHVALHSHMSVANFQVLAGPLDTRSTTSLRAATLVLSLERCRHILRRSVPPVPHQSAEVSALRCLSPVHLASPVSIYTFAAKHHALAGQRAGQCPSHPPPLSYGLADLSRTRSLARRWARGHTAAWRAA